MIDGILLVDKQKGITSYDVIRDIKRKLDKKAKIGHAGTLDPFATGMLIILLGKGTKLMELFHTLSKEYVVEAKLGISTDTQDITGEIVNTSSVVPSIEDIKNVISEKYIGSISQVPPKYSAKKVNGRKAYDMARQGLEFELKPKAVTVYSYDVLDYVYPVLKARIVCSTGTYIRTLINDLGLDLDCLATAYSLRRTKIGNYNIDNAISCDVLREMSFEQIQSKIISVDNVIKDIENAKR